jgi:hypothetical protein
VRELISFFRRLNWPVWHKFVSHALFYGWIAGFCFAAAVLAIYYQSTLLDIWHDEFPSTQPPLAIGVPVTNMSCVQS